MCNHNVSVMLDCGDECKVNGAGFLGIREYHGGECGIGVKLLGHGNGRAETRLDGGGCENFTTDTMHCGVHHGEIGVLWCDQAGRAILIIGDHRVWNVFPVIAVGEIGHRS